MPRLNSRTEQKRSERLIEIIARLSEPHASPTIYELADDFSVDLRTLRRDLALLGRLGFALDANAPKRGRQAVLKLAPGGPLSAALSFTEAELTALYFMREFSKALSGTLLEKAAGSALEKIEPLFDDTRLERLKQAVRVKLGPTRDYSEHGETVLRLLNAIVERRKVKIAYYSEKSKRYDSFALSPYTLLFHANAFYLIGDSEKHKACRTFAIERIDRVEVLHQSFDYPEDLDKKLELDRHFGVYSGEVKNVVIRVLPQARKRMKAKRIHASQRFSFQKDGSALLYLDVAGKQDLFRWLLSQGDRVRLEAPVEWVNDYRELIERIKNQYQAL